MSIPITPEPSIKPTGLVRVKVALVVQIANMLSHLRPNHLERLLRVLAKGAVSSRTAEVSAIRASVCATSSRCAGLGCLQRSIATFILCRTSGHVPVWKSGFRLNPFAAHAWVEVDGLAVDEPDGVSQYRAVLSAGQSTDHCQSYRQEPTAP